ncbi:uncharacterized protein COLE_04385 [Cutaneotrichosporon oleaginosum]|uniref:uncharacterized protein n=1 Tax=Cutaneotrichosporon oleaginosum TaxID=879819 RepID=UPI001323FE6A|nr:hypothetical protein COLE_04385 [Cutaneotrichosporon oleaginosum]
MAPTLKHRDVVPVIRKLGWIEKRGKGSHTHYIHPSRADVRITITAHGTGGTVDAAVLNTLRAFVDRDDPCVPESWFRGVPQDREVSCPAV